MFVVGCKDRQSTIYCRPVFPEDGGIPMSAEKQLMDESGLLLESPLTQMLRHEGRVAAWFTHSPDHSND
ncbi:unnamed protein product [Sphagnum tenellum]|uniref:Uncharacterized protein n=2 Tax=Sphagnum jensenii TaxID=128206 RepID=A0ABP1BIT3_9BRYO